MLHIIKTPSALHDVQRYMAASDSLLLVEDAVYAANPQHFAYTLMNTALSQTKVYVLKEDVLARGVSSSIDEITHLVDYAGFVDLTAEHTHSMTWD